MYPYVKEVLLGKGENSLSSLGTRISASAKINFKMWHNDTTWDKHFSDLYDFMSVRADYVDRIFDAYEALANGDTTSYTDVSKEVWFYEAVSDVSAFGFMSGTGDGFFEPYKTVKRAEVAQVLFNIMGADEKTFSETFSDVSESDWYSSAVIKASESGLITGFPDGTFRPEQEITREELAVILHRLEKMPAESADMSRFNDGEKVSPYALSAIEWAIDKKVMSGDDKGNLNPAQTLTRAELATMLCRYVKIQ